MPEMTGGVMSMFTLAIARVLTLPALSMQVPDADCPLPSALKSRGGVHASMPERASVPEKVTVTLVLFQSFALERGFAAALAAGGVLSMRTGSVFGVSWFWVLSVAKYVSVVFPSGKILTTP